MPLVAVTASHAKQAQPYQAALERRGADTMALSPETYNGLASATDGVAGLLLCGGADIHPKHYGQEIDPDAGVKTDEPRDEMELALLRHALSLGMPILAICRGMQVLNVALGGSLIQHIDGHGPAGERSSFHQAFVSPGSKLGAIIGLGAVYRVNSLHHQGLRDPQLAPGLLASAYHPLDGIIEALESPAHDWVIGVQCHPERASEVPRSFLKLFDWLVGWAERFEVGDMS